MKLYDPEREPGVAPEDAVIVAHRFVTRCLTWAEERELPKRLDEVRDGLDPDRAARLHAWVAYRAFLLHTLRELEDGTLDGWFTDPPAPPTPTTTG